MRRKLVLEITERGAPDPMGLRWLRDIDTTEVQIALDDVGLDDSSLVVLARVRVDIVKPDKRVVDQLPGDPDGDGGRILRRVKALAEAGNSKVIAEGIEHAAQAQALHDAGVESGQGWFYSKSLPADAFIAWHAAHRGG